MSQDSTLGIRILRFRKENTAWADALDVCRLLDISIDPLTLYLFLPQEDVKSFRVEDPLKETSKVFTTINGVAILCDSFITPFAYSVKTILTKEMNEFEQGLKICQQIQGKEGESSLSRNSSSSDSSKS